MIYFICLVKCKMSTFHCKYLSWFKQTRRCPTFYNCPEWSVISERVLSSDSGRSVLVSHRHRLCLDSNPRTSNPATMSWRFKASKYKNAAPIGPKNEFVIRDLSIGSYNTGQCRVSSSTFSAPAHIWEAGNYYTYLKIYHFYQLVTISEPARPTWPSTGTPWAPASPCCQ